MFSVQHMLSLESMNSSTAVASISFNTFFQVTCIFGLLSNFHLLICKQTS